MHHWRPFFEKIPGEAPGPPPAGGIPPALSPCAASRGFGYAPGSGPSGSATGGMCDE